MSFWVLLCFVLIVFCCWPRTAWELHRLSAFFVLEICFLIDSLAVILRFFQFSISFYPRDAMLARVIEIATRLSVRPYVCLSVTHRYCVKTKKASVMISSPSCSPMILVFWRRISSQNSKGFPRTGASKKGGVRKFSDFLALSVNISKTVADRAKVTISD